MSVGSELRCVGAWVLVAFAALVGGGVTLLFGSWAYFFIRGEPRHVLFGLLWLVVALSVPIATEAARRVGVRNGVQREALLIRVSVTTIVVAQGTLILMSVLYVLGAYFQW